ncbi:hypothetical protein HBH69_112520 [Parastagonospora nodorum]|nr:hypothetical protein HBH69_112520 [Parastagonospora nodorum]
MPRKSSKPTKPGFSGNAGRRQNTTKSSISTKQRLNTHPSAQYIPHKPTHASDILTISHPSPLYIHDKHYPPRPLGPVSGQQVMAHQQLWQTYAMSGPLDDVSDDFGLGFGDVSAYIVVEGREEDGEGWGSGRGREWEGGWGRESKGKGRERKGCHIHQHIHQHISKPSNIIMQLRPSVKSAFRKLTGAGRHRQPSYDSSSEDSDYDYPRDGHRLYDQRQQAPNYQEQQEMSYQRQQATNYSRQPTDYRHQQDMDYQRHQQAPNYQRQRQDQVRMFATSGPLDDEYDRDVSPCVVAGEKEQGKGMKMAGAWVD